MKKLLFCAAMGVAAVMAAPVAMADVVTLNTVFDLSHREWDASYLLGFRQYFGADKVLTTGDVIDLTWVAKPGQSLTYSASPDGGSFTVVGGLIQDYFSPNPSSRFSISHISMDLIGASSNVPLQMYWPIESGGVNAVYSEGEGTLLANQSVRFTGLHARFTLDQMEYGTNKFDSAELLLLPSNGTVTAAVPEPETWAMLAAGLGFLGFAARRRKQAL